MLNFLGIFLGLVSVFSAMGCTRLREIGDEALDTSTLDGGYPYSDAEPSADQGIGLDAFVSCLSPTPDVCDGVDNDCDSSTSDGSAEERSGRACDGDDDDRCATGTYHCTSGTWICMGERPSPELCNNEVDDDCDERVDEDSASDATTYYPDSDEDGYGDPSAAVTLCDPPSTGDWVTIGGDCDDTTSAVSPDADEVCNGRDDDCDGDVDDGGILCGLACFRGAYDRSVYQVCLSTMRTWDLSREQCQSYGYDLAIIDSEEEEDYLRSILPSELRSFFFWFGLRDDDDAGWAWVDGRALSRPNWAPTEPSYDCAGISAATSGWQTRSCAVAAQSGYICEVTPLSIVRD